MPPCAAATDPTDPFAASRSAFTALTVELSAEPAARLGHAELEELLDLRGRDLLRQLLQDHLELRQVREERAVRACPVAVTGADGVTRRAVETGHSRLLATILGTVVVGRCGWRAQGRVNAYPADAALRLPRLRHSHGLRRLAAVEAVRGSFDQATETIGRRCGQVAGKRQVEQLTVAAAADIDAFSRAVVAQPCTDATVLVLSVDGKGVVMRPEALREATLKAAQAKGAGTYRTRLPVASSRDASGWPPLGWSTTPPRLPAAPTMSSVSPPPPPGGRSGQRPRRAGPNARAKWLTGSVTRPGEQVIGAVFDQATQRDPTHRRTWVVLVDGARHQLDQRAAGDAAQCRPQDGGDRRGGRLDLPRQDGHGGAGRAPAKSRFVANVTSATSPWTHPPSGKSQVRRQRHQSPDSGRNGHLTTLPRPWRCGCTSHGGPGGPTRSSGCIYRKRVTVRNCARSGFPCSWTAVTRAGSVTRWNPSGRRGLNPDRMGSGRAAAVRTPSKRSI